MNNPSARSGVVNRLTHRYETRNYHMQQMQHKNDIKDATVEWKKGELKRANTIADKYWNAEKEKFAGIRKANETNQQEIINQIRRKAEWAKTKDIEMSGTEKAVNWKLLKQIHVEMSPKRHSADIR